MRWPDDGRSSFCKEKVIVAHDAIVAVEERKNNKGETPNPIDYDRPGIIAVIFQTHYCSSVLVIISQMLSSAYRTGDAIDLDTRVKGQP